MPFAPTAEQQAALDAFRTGDHLTIEAGAGTGKTSTLKLLAADAPGRRGIYFAYNRALRDDQPVLTPSGWRPIGDLAVGDQVLGSDGNPHLVTKVHPRGVRPLYEVAFNDGTKVVADDEHLWVTQTIVYDAKRNGGQWKVRSTEQIAKTLHQKHRVPMLDAAAQFAPEMPLPLDPYLLGALLGDGSFKHRAVLFSSVSGAIPGEIAKVLPEGVAIQQIKDKRGRSWSITDSAHRNSNRILDALRELELAGVGGTEKFVPVQYLLASPQTRVALLQGLMDTDGCSRGTQSLFVTTSRHLVDAVVFIAQSLGGHAFVGFRESGKDGRLEHWSDSYLVNIKLPLGMNPFRVARKAAAWRDRVRDVQMPRRIVSITRVDDGPATCISVDATDHLFVTAGCILTHNSIADEAAATFPGTVLAKTLHALANGTVRRHRPHLIERMNQPRQTSKAVAELLGIAGPSRVSADVVLAPWQVASIVLETIERFCYSSDPVPTRQHMPWRPNMKTPAVRDALASIVGPYARKAWADIQAPGGLLTTRHDHYLKSWALTEPLLRADYVLVDEAQDSNSLTAGIVRNQVAKGTQAVIVGDENQAIYSWRGSSSIMREFPGPRVRLTTSWRFGPAVADEANQWLAYLSSSMRLRGNPALRTQVGGLTDLPDAVLCRSNARAVETLIEYHEEGIPARIEGGAQDVRRLAEGAADLKATGRSWHPDLTAFTSWGQVQDFVESDHAGTDLKTAVRLIDKWDTTGLIAALDKQAPKNRARVVMSTAHKAKGLEWNRVRIESDFPSPKDRDDTEFESTREDAMLAYVSVTRAQQHLDATSLAWVHDAVRDGKRAS